MNDLEVLRIRLEAAREAQSRARVSLFVCTVISLCLMFVCWNAYLSWYRSFALRDVWTGDEITKFAQQELVSEWIKSRVVSVPLLGIHIGVSDAAILATLSLLIATIWFYLACRRENHAIGTLLRDTKNSPRNVRDMVLHGTVSYMVFTSVTQSDDPIQSLASAPSSRTNISVGGVLNVLVFLPFIAVIFLIVLDIVSLFQESPFRDRKGPLAFELKTDEIVVISVMTGVALIMATLIGVLCYWIVRYLRSTAKVLREYMDLQDAISH